MSIPTANIALRAEGLVKKYGKLTAVDGVSLQVAAGECFALLGPNGAGKTTVCELLEGLLTPDAGEVYLCHLSLKTQRQEILKRIGVQLQETHLYKKYTVRETLELFASFYPQSQPLDPLLEKLKLQDKQHARLEHLSGGQKQRVYLGCALVNKPELIFLDEPTSGLDPQARRHIWDLLKELKDENCSIFLTTHHMEEAQELADRIAIMDQGKIIACGSLAELKSKYCQGEFLRFKLHAEDKLRLMQGLTWLRTARSLGEEQYEAIVANATLSTQELMREADKHNIAIRNFAIQQGSLEDVFLQLTGRSIRDE